MSLRKMTQFVVHKNCTKAAKKGRLGHLTVDLKSLPTPAFFVHTLGGSVPHLTADTLTCFPPGHSLHSPPLVISVDSTFTLKDVLDAGFSGGIGKFVGLPNSLVFLSLHNSLVPLRGGYNDKNGVALWTRTGRTSIDTSGYHKIVQQFKPHIFQGISDYDVTKASGSKRVRKSTSRAVEHLEDVNKTRGALVDSPGFFVTIEAAWFLADEIVAKNTVASLAEKVDQIQGFVVQGISHSPTNEVPVDKKYSKQPVIVQDLCLELVEKVMSTLPVDKPKYVPGPFKLSQILQLVRSGVDLFDSSIVTRMADDGEAFTFDCLIANGVVHSKFSSRVNESLPKRDEGNVTTSENLEIKPTDDIVLSLKDKMFFDDFNPISKNCECYTCRHHTRSYINHLYATDELLGPVLLMIHNLSLFSQFFQMVRDTLEEDHDSEPVPSSATNNSKLTQLLALLKDN